MRRHRQLCQIITYLSRWLGEVTQGIRQFQWQYTIHLIWWLLGTVTVDLAKDAVMAVVNLVNNRYHRMIWRWMTPTLGKCLACLRWIICHPHPRGGQIMGLWQLNLLHRLPWTC